MPKGIRGAALEENHTPKGLRIPSTEIVRERKSMKKMEDRVLLELASRLEKECACLSSTASSDDWYIDSGASAHMTGERDHFSSY